MTRQIRWVTRCSGAGAALAMLALVGEARAQTSFWIDESTDFTGNGCANDDVNTVTSSLNSELLNNSWTGSRFVNANAWPQDFTESCSASRSSTRVSASGYT